MNPSETAKAGPSGEKPFKCGDCGMGFPTKWQVAEHIWGVHLATDSFQCAECDKVYKRKSALQKHIKTEHLTEEGSHKSECLRCGKMFKCLAEHIKIVHNKEERSHKCQVCSQRFPYASYLAAHMRVHTGDKPFECDRCSEKFAKKSNLKRHVDAVHRQEKPFQCDVCFKFFGHKPTLLRHSKIHSRSKEKGKQKRTSAASSSSIDLVSESKVVGNAVIIKEEQITDEEYEEQFPSTSLGIVEAADVPAVKLEEVLLNWPGEENDDADGTSY